jgi:transposase
MRQKSVASESPSERLVKNIRRVTRKRHSAEEKIRIVLDGLRGESSIAELCRREGIAESLYYAWSKEFLEAGKRRLAGDTARAATSGEVKDLRRGPCRPSTIRSARDCHPWVRSVTHVSGLDMNWMVGAQGLEPWTR